MNFLLDQGLPRSTVKSLATRGITAEHVGDLGLATGSDEAILDTARQRSLVLVTLDADFHKLLATSQQISPSVIRIRIEGLRGDALARIVQQVATVASRELTAGAVVSVTPSRIRIRSLPIHH